MALIAMATWCTPENERGKLLECTLDSVLQTVNFDRHRLVVVDNGSTDERAKLALSYKCNDGIRHRNAVELDRNRGTAYAINRAWDAAAPDEVRIKMDDDVVFRSEGWADELEDTIRANPSIGICGLKRKDLDERPDHPKDHYRSTLAMLPHEPGERWRVVEIVQHVMGTCQAYSPKLIHDIGGLYQMQDEGNVYGFDDSLASLRSQLAGYTNCFLPHIDIDHIDPGGTKATQDKSDSAGRWMSRYFEVREEYKAGTRQLRWED